MSIHVQARVEEFARNALPLHQVLYRQAISLIQVPESAEDLVQETFLRAFRRFDTFRQSTNLHAWMARILFNLFVNHYRRKRNEGSHVELELAQPFLGKNDKPSSDVERESPVRMMQDERFLQSLEGPVKRELEGLDAKFREVLLMNTVGGESYEQIAGKLGIPIGTVMSRLHRAKSTLRARLPLQAGFAP